MENLISVPFNPKSPTVLHLDLNSCFATIEQQANPRLRGKPIAVAAYDSPNGCIVAPSIEAKKLGIQVGMRVKDGKMICPELIIKCPDPWKYRNVHLEFRRILGQYTDNVVPKSIDEFVLNLEGFPAYKKGVLKVGEEIKEKIKREVGDWLTVSIGIAPNRFLAKTASNLHKPDGLDVIDVRNYKDVYKSLRLTDLTGIKVKNAIRLNNFGIFSVMDFYNAGERKLRAAFQSIVGYYWYVRLHGWEVDDIEFGRRSYGNSYALQKPLTTLEELSPLIQKLSEKCGFRMRKAGYWAKGIHVAAGYRDGGFWHRGFTTPEYVFASRDIYAYAIKLINKSPYLKPVRDISVSVFNIEKMASAQLSLLDDFEKKRSLVNAIDSVNERWGNFVITPGKMLGMQEVILDRVAFGGVKELEEIIIN